MAAVSSLCPSPVAPKSRTFSQSECGSHLSEGNWGLAASAPAVDRSPKKMMMSLVLDMAEDPGWWVTRQRDHTIVARHDDRTKTFAFRSAPHSPVTVLPSRITLDRTHWASCLLLSKCAFPPMSRKMRSGSGTSSARRGVSRPSTRATVTFPKSAVCSWTRCAGPSPMSTDTTCAPVSANAWVALPVAQPISSTESLRVGSSLAIRRNRRADVTTMISVLTG